MAFVAASGKSTTESTFNMSTADMTKSHECNKCDVCHYPMRSRCDEWTLYCDNCGHWSSAYEPNAAALSDDEAVDAREHEAAFGSLRSSNWQHILDVLERYRPIRHLRICDVGCAYGQFIRMVQERGAVGTGIEANAHFASAAQRTGLDVMHGLFPRCLRDEDRFDIITFHDVLEHIPHPRDVVASCRQRLADDGILVLALPSSNGVFFRLSLALKMLGVRGPFNRLWQRQFFTPHVSYFNESNLTTLVTESGFDLIHTGSLRSASVTGMWKRLACDANASLAYPRRRLFRCRAARASAVAITG